MQPRGHIQEAVQEAWLMAQAAQNSLGNQPPAATNLYANLAQMWTGIAQLLIQVEQGLNPDDFDCSGG